MSRTRRTAGRAAGSVLRDAGFLRLWSATTASGLATWALPFVLGLTITAGDARAGTVGAALATRTVGFLLALPLSGVLADRTSPRPVVRWSALAAAAATCPLAWALGRETWVVLVAALVVGAGQGACRPAFQAYVPLVVPDARRQQANAAITVAVRTTVLAGPAVAGLASVLLAPAWLVAATAALWLVAALAPPPVPPTPRREERTGVVAGFAEGVAEARRHPWFLGGLGALAAVITTGYSVTAVALPLVSRSESGSASLLVAGATAYTAGALAGALTTARWRPASAGWVALAALGAYAVVPLSLIAPAPLPVVVTAFAIAGFGIELFNVPWFTAAQREIPPDRLSRVSSLDFLVSYGLAPLGLALIAPAIDAVGLDTVLWTCAAACVLGPILAALVPSSRHFSTRHDV